VTSQTWQSLKKQADDASKPLPDDWYEVTVAKAEVKTASTGSLMIVAQLAVTAGPHTNRRLFNNFVLSVDSSFALSMFFKNMTAFGLDDNFFAQLPVNGDDWSPGLQLVAEALLGRNAKAQVGTRTWNGQERNEILQLAQSTRVGAPTVNVVTPGGSSNSAPTPNLGGGTQVAAASVPPVPSVVATPSAATPASGDDAPPVPAF
jgi:hypothetical protein